MRSFYEFLEMMQDQMTPQQGATPQPTTPQPEPPQEQEESPDEIGVKVPSAYKAIMTQIRSKSPNVIINIQRQFNADIQKILSSKSSGYGRQSLRATRNDAATALSHYNQQSQANGVGS